MKDENTNYHLSQYWFVNRDKEELYISNPFDHHNNYRVKLSKKEVELVLTFTKPKKIPSKNKKIQELVEKGALVDHEEVNDAFERCFNMIETLKKISGLHQEEYLQRTPTNNFLRNEQCAQKNESVISILKGKGLEIGGNVPNISPFVDIASLDISTYAKDLEFKQDATSLDDVDDCSYDFIINSHILEHLTNPLKALYEWKRVIKDGGYIYFVLPNKEYTNDFHKPLTTVEHLKEDYENDVGLYDLTHVQDPVDWLAMENFQMSKSPYVHHHKFTMKSFREILDYTGFEIMDSWESKPFNLHALVRKVQNRHDKKLITKYSHERNVLLKIIKSCKYSIIKIYRNLWGINY